MTAIEPPPSIHARGSFVYQQKPTPTPGAVKWHQGCHEAALRMQLSCELALALRCEPQAMHTTRQDTCCYYQNAVLKRNTDPKNQSDNEFWNPVQQNQRKCNCRVESQFGIYSWRAFANSGFYLDSSLTAITAHPYFRLPRVHPNGIFVPQTSVAFSTAN